MSVPHSDDFLRITPGTLPTARLHAYLLGGVAPRPIALVSTINAEGGPNLAPFSFFNVFGSNPPIAVFSPARRVRDNTLKHTLLNLQEVGECVIHAVSYDMVQQTSLASCEYEAGVNEFTKAGFTAVPSDTVRPPRVAEARFALECRLVQILETGSEGGAGNLIICQVNQIHVHRSVLDAQENIDPHKIDLVARAGGDWYVRAQGEALFEVPKPNIKKGMGIDRLPEEIRLSPVLTGNHLGILGNFESVPALEPQSALSLPPSWETADIHQKHRWAAQYLDQGKWAEAWYLLLANNA